MLGGGQIEYRTSVISEIQSVLAIGHVDPVREEEIRSNQHVRVRKIDIGKAQSGIANFLLTDLEARNRRDVGLDRVPANSPGWARVDYAPGIRLYPRSCRSLERQKGNRRSGIEHHANLNAVDVGSAESVRELRRPRCNARGHAPGVEYRLRCHFDDGVRLGRADP